MVTPPGGVKKPGLLFAGVLLFLFSAPSLFSEGDLSLELGISNLIMQTRKVNTIIGPDIDPDTSKPTVSYIGGDKYWAWMTAGSAGFSFKSQGNKNVKADLAFSFAEAGEDMMPVISLDRAYAKARFPALRITAGKTRLSWGDGFVFNSGDIIFGSTDTSIDLTASEVRTDTAWLSALNVPLGRFSFIEGVILPPVPDAATGFVIGNLNRTSGGGRFYTKLAGIKLEGGYFFDQTGDECSYTDWKNALHRTYLGFQGNLLADWNLSGSVALPVDGNIEQTAKDSFNLSGGLFHMVNINSISSITFRLEGLYRPFYGWEEEDWAADEESPDYAILLYPEIGYSPTDTVSLSLRSICSPIDRSAMITTGFGWNVFEGFDLSGYAVFNAGDPDDSFAWERDNSIWSAGENIIDSAAVIISINYIY